jgi:hypothetical protein
VIRNPFPQLSRVAVTPFFNQSDEPTVDGRQVAMAYYAELQSTPGFEVVPLGVVEEAIIAHRVDLHGPGEARRLANILGVDAVAVGAVTDFAEYYPPRLGLRVEWYTANPGFHEIPAGYGLPWGTPEEEFIPDSLVYESQMALAKAEMQVKTPDCDAYCQTLPAPPVSTMESSRNQNDANAPSDVTAPSEGPESKMPSSEAPADGAEPAEAPISMRVLDNGVRQAQLEVQLPQGAGASNGAIDATGAVRDSNGVGAIVAASPAAIDPQCPAPSSPTINRPPCIPYHGPVLTHTRLYRGNDADVSEALRGYVAFRDDHRFGGWKSYLSRSDDFVRFCCHMHICEMLSARGGSRKTDVVWRWPESR